MSTVNDESFLIDDLPALDMHGSAFLHDPHAEFDRLRATSPLARSRRGIEVLTYDANYRLYPERLMDTPGIAGFIEKKVPPLFQEFVEQGFLLGFHGERHDLVRRVIQKGFSLRQIDSQRGLMRQVANELIDAFDVNDVDFVRDYTIKFPVISICRLLGVPEQDIPRFQDASIVLHLMGAVPLAPGFPQIEASLAVLKDYVSDIVAKRRAQPQEDFISALIEAQETEGQLTELELVWNIANLLFAGQDTTRFQLAGIVRAAIQEPGQAWERLAADPGLVQKIIWEGMRFYPAVQWSSRKPLKPFKFDNFRFEKGQWVFLNNLAASRDPAAFEQPHRYDIDRPEIFHVPFGRGAHHCVGQMLARIGMEESLKVLSSRLADFVIDGHVQVVKPSAMVGGPVAMPVRFRMR